MCSGSGACADIDAVATDCSGMCSNYCSSGSCINADTGVGTCIVATNKVANEEDGRCASGTCVAGSCYTDGNTCADPSECCSTHCYVDSDGDGYVGTSGTKTCRTSASLGTDLDDSDVCTDTVIHSCGQVSGGSCVPKSAGEQSQAACQRCNEISIDAVNIADDTGDSEGSSLCDATSGDCYRCLGGFCTHQTNSQDLFSECNQGSTASDGCKSNYCSGSGYSCGVQTTGKGGCPACGYCGGVISCEYPCGSQPAVGPNACINVCVEVLPP